MKKLMASILSLCLIASVFPASALETPLPIIYEVEEPSSRIESFISRFFTRAKDFRISEPTVPYTARKYGERNMFIISSAGAGLDGYYDQDGYLSVVFSFERQASGQPIALCAISSLLWSDKEYQDTLSADDGAYVVQRDAQIFLNQLLQQGSITTGNGVVFSIQLLTESSSYQFHVDFRNAAF